MNFNELIDEWDDLPSYFYNRQNKILENPIIFIFKDIENLNKILRPLFYKVQVKRYPPDLFIDSFFVIMTDEYFELEFLDENKNSASKKIAMKKYPDLIDGSILDLFNEIDFSKIRYAKINLIRSNERSLFEKLNSINNAKKFADKIVSIYEEELSSISEPILKELFLKTVSKRDIFILNNFISNLQRLPVNKVTHNKIVSIFKKSMKKRFSLNHKIELKKELLSLFETSQNKN